MKTFMVVERFRPGRMDAVYERFAAKGRLLTAGLEYIESWRAPDAEICFQLMRAEDAARFEPWFAHWADLVEFELHKIR